MNGAISNVVVAVVTAFIVSAGSSLAIGWKDQAVDAVGLQQNTEAIKELTQVVKELQINEAVFSERYITRKELDQRLKESQ